VMLLAPQGLWGLFAERYKIEVFPVRRHARLSSRTPAC
jgi:hypothetical protein